MAPEPSEASMHYLCSLCAGFSFVRSFIHLFDRSFVRSFIRVARVELYCPPITGTDATVESWGAEAP